MNLRLIYLRIIFLLLLLNFSHASQETTYTPPYNFGTLVSNAEYKIYRSAWLGKKRLMNLHEKMEELDLDFPKAIIYMNKTGYKWWSWKTVFTGLDFAWQEYSLQEELGFRFFHSFDYENRTYIDGHNPFFPTLDIDSMNLLGRSAKRAFGESPDDGVDGGIESFFRVLDMVLNIDNQPVLFHCWGGRHRTGMIALAIRYIQGGDFIKELPIDSQFEWKEMTIKTKAEIEYLKYASNVKGRPENIYFMRRLVGSDRFQEYIKTYRDLLQN